MDADTTTTKNNNKSTENIVQEEKSCETEEIDENKKEKSESDLSDISSKNPEIIVEAADNEEKKGMYTWLLFIYFYFFRETQFHERDPLLHLTWKSISRKKSYFFHENLFEKKILVL